MKYMIITSKHHDGFAMFNTAATDYNVVDDTPWHTDPMKALSKACKKYGIKFGFYYSIMDWHSPYQLPHDDSNPQHPTYNPTKIKPGKKDDYINYMKTELQELVKQYDPAVLWFDGEWPDWWTYQDGKNLYNYVRSLKPDIIINNRVGKRRKGKEMVGDYGTPEQEIPPNGIPGSYWETCMTINDHWGYYKGDHDFKSDTTLIRNLIDIASKGGNYLLNVGPTAQGIIPLPEVKRLSAMGHWLNIYGKAIYATKPSPFKKQFKWGRVTQKQNKLYLEIFHWPKDGKLTLPAYEGTIASVHLMGDPDRSGLSALKQGIHMVINLPGEAPNDIASVVEVDFK
jgi:alpha-L-fucosidase